jgi:BNR repeat-like domain
MNRISVGSVVLSVILTSFAAHGEWNAHGVRFLNKTNDEVTVPARMQIVTESWNRVVAVPYIVYMPEKDRMLLLVGCDYPHHAEVLWSDDRGCTWSAPQRVLFDKSGKGIDGLGVSLTYLGKGKVLFATRASRWASDDFGKTWGKLSAVAKACDGKPWYMWDPIWVDQETETGNVLRLIETGYTEYNPPEVKKKCYQGHIRFSEDLGKTWTQSIKVPQWKSVDEVALVRAANGDLVAAGRTNIPPSKEGEWLDHFEGLSVSTSKDDGNTWSEITKLYDWGRHHPSMALLPDGHIVMTYVVRKGYVDTPDGFPQFGIEAIVSADHGRTWDLDHKYILHSWSGSRKDQNKWWPSSQATSTVLLPDNSLLTAFGTGYRIQPPPGKQQPRDAGQIRWRLSDAAVDDDRTIRDAAVDSDMRNICDPKSRRLSGKMLGRILNNDINNLISSSSQ